MLLHNFLGVTESVQDVSVCGRHHPEGHHQLGGVQSAEADGEEEEGETEVPPPGAGGPRHASHRLPGSGAEGGQSVVSVCVSTHILDCDVN